MLQSCFTCFQSLGIKAKNISNKQSKHIKQGFFCFFVLAGGVLKMLITCNFDISSMRVNLLGNILFKTMFSTTNIWGYTFETITYCRSDFYNLSRREQTCTDKLSTTVFVLVSLLLINALYILELKTSSEPLS